MNNFPLQNYVEPGNAGALVGAYPASIPGYRVYARTITVNTTNGNQLLLAAWHLAASNRNLWLRQARADIYYAAGAVVSMTLEVVRISSAPTGGTTVTPFAYNKANSPESAGGFTGMSLPTGGGTVDGVLDGVEKYCAIGGQQASALITPSIIIGDFNPDKGIEMPRARAGFLEGFAIRLVSDVVATAGVTLSMEIGEA